MTNRNGPVSRLEPRVFPNNQFNHPPFTIETIRRNESNTEAIPRVLPNNRFNQPYFTFGATPNQGYILGWSLWFV